MMNHDRKFAPTSSDPFPQGANFGLALINAGHRRCQFGVERSQADTPSSMKVRRWHSTACRSFPGGAMCEICRRGFIGGAAALGATGLFSSPVMAQTQGGSSSARLPARDEFTIANAYVMTMDGSLGDIAGCSVHVRNGEIVAVAKDITGGKACPTPNRPISHRSRPSPKTGRIFPTKAC
jgi:hypothetical protein